MKTTNRKAHWAMEVRFFPLAIVSAVFAVAAIAGYAYSQNLTNGTGWNSGMYAQSDSGMMSGASSISSMSSVECDQMMQSLNISQSAISSMDQIMRMHSDGQMQDMM